MSRRISTRRIESPSPGIQVSGRITDGETNLVGLRVAFRAGIPAIISLTRGLFLVEPFIRISVVTGQRTSSRARRQVLSDVDTSRRDPKCDGLRNTSLSAIVLYGQACRCRRRFNAGDSNARIRFCRSAAGPRPVLAIENRALDLAPAATCDLSPATDS